MSYPTPEGCELPDSTTRLAGISTSRGLISTGAEGCPNPDKPLSNMFREALMNGTTENLWKDRQVFYFNYLCMEVFCI